MTDPVSLVKEGPSELSSVLIQLFKGPLTLDDYMAARPIADPIHLFDCVMPCAGAEAFLVMSDTRARGLGLPFASLRGAIERHNAFSADPVMERGGCRMCWVRSCVQGSASSSREPCSDRRRFSGVSASAPKVRTPRAAPPEPMVPMAPTSHRA